MNIWSYARAQWDRTAAGALFAVGALLLVLGWVGVSREALTALQVPYIISGGLGGIFLLGLGAVFWLSADLRDEWRKLDALEAAITRRELSEARDGVGDAVADATSGNGDGTGRSDRRPIRAS